MDAALLLGACWALPLLALIPLLRRRPDVAKSPLDQATSVSIIIPARNESRTIDDLLTSLRSSTHRAFEVLVVDDRSTDDTAERVRRHAADDARIKLIHGAPLPTEWFGKPWACHQGAAASTGEILLFTDADTRHHPELLAHAVGALRHDSVDLLTLTSHQICATFWERLVMPQIWLLLGIRFVPSRINRATQPAQVVANGQFIMMPRTSYDIVGGHEKVRGEVVEDLALAQQTFTSGLQVRMMFGETLLATRMYRSLGAMIEGWSKNLYTGARQSMRDYPVLVPFAPLMVMAVFLFWMIPPVALGLGFLPVTTAVATVASLLLWATVSFLMRIPLAYALGYPLGALVALGIMIRSTIRGRRKIVWKGREYATTAMEGERG